MESILFHDSSSGESDNEEGVQDTTPSGAVATASGGVTAPSARPVPSTTPPAATKPHPLTVTAPPTGTSGGSSNSTGGSGGEGQLDQMSRLKSLYQQQPKRPPPTTNSGSNTPQTSNRSSIAPPPQKQPQQQTQQQPSRQQQQPQMKAYPHSRPGQGHADQQRQQQLQQQHPPHQMPNRSLPPNRPPHSQADAQLQQPQYQQAPTVQQQQQQQYRRDSSSASNQVRSTPHGIPDHFAPSRLNPSQQQQQQHRQQPQHPPSQHRLTPQPHQQQRHPQQQPGHLARGGGESQDRAAMEQARRQKENFIAFTNILIKYLEKKDPGLHKQARSIIKDCADRNRRKEPGYESVTAAIRERLKELVGEAYWKRTEAHFEQYQIQVRQRQQPQQQRESRQDSSSQPPGGSGSGSSGGMPAPQQQPQHHQQQQQLTQQERQRKMQAAQQQKVPHQAQPKQSQLQHEQQKSQQQQQPEQQPQQPQQQHEEPKQQPKQQRDDDEEATPGTAAPTIEQVQRDIAAQKAKVAAAGGKGKKPAKKRVSTGSTGGANRKVPTTTAPSPAPVASPKVAETTDPETLPPREYNELMKSVDHVIDFDWKTAGLLLGSKMDLQLTDEQQSLLYGEMIGSSKPAKVDEDVLASGISPGWSRRNVVSVRNAWAAVRLRELKKTQRHPSSQPVVGDTGLTLQEASKKTVDPVEVAAWVNEEQAEEDPVLAMLSEATQIYLRGVLEKAIQCARQRQNLDGIRLWHQQSAYAVQEKDGDSDETGKTKEKPALSLRLGCDVERQQAQAAGNAAMTVKRMEQALERQSHIPVRSRMLEDDTLRQATSMSDLAMRPQLAKGVEMADLHGKRSFEIYGGKDATEPPLGRVPKQAKLEASDFVMGSLMHESFGRHRARNSAASIFF